MPMLTCLHMFHDRKINKETTFCNVYSVVLTTKIIYVGLFQQLLVCLIHVFIYHLIHSFHLKTKFDCSCILISQK